MERGTTLRQRTRALLWPLLLLLGLSATGLFSWPGRIRAISGNPALLPVPPPVRVAGPEDRVLIKLHDRQGAVVQFDRPGSVRLELSLFGLFPLPPMVVDVVPPLELVPGGQAIGVLLAPHGLVVAEMVPVREPSGRVRYPGKEAGLQAGDLLLEADGQLLRRPEDLTLAIQGAGSRGRPVELLVARGNHRFRTSLLPSPIQEATSRSGGRSLRSRAGYTAGVRWVAGLLVRDTAAGVGTLTFVDPRTRRFGALGHMIVEADRRPLVMPDGRIVRAAITSVAAGMRGRPGEKVGAFEDSQGELGIVDQNTAVGIFGRIVRDPPAGLVNRPVPVALESQVREGPATMLTVLRGERVESFQIEILRIRTLGVPPSQRLVLRVTDPRLLEQAGGIVQGMSGSPILQDGHLVGAVTHVAIQEPSRGFGVLMEAMAETAGLWKVPGGQVGRAENKADRAA
ncbi:SpoIVB peptidase [Carboxydochorda subterranea]|uniref:SpoIVB peptidase n=1 Tax=Carboxydichorda subterranea TaxID=3109565 RepID=A0ABZ1BZT4_9FIRM|nr:SpoIVB peptidase [Limnochorda sp. L945t]WRP18339.1 SpoIVB peptidase [Limnochorda sp. L945t]